MIYYNTKIEALKIRESIIEDTNLLLNLIVEMAEYEKLAHEVVATEESLSKSIFIKKRANALILELDEKPIGYVIYFFNYSTFNGACGLYLEDIYIKKEYRGNGIGKEVFNLLFKIALEEDCKRIEWTCLNWNELAKQFYKSLGAVPMDEWTVHRLTENDIISLVHKN